MGYREKAAAHYEKYLATVQPDLQREGDLAARLYARNLKPHLPPAPHAAIGDLGCGFGLFLSFLRELGYQSITGVDICPGFAPICRSQGFEIHIEDNVSFLRQRPQQFDCITLNYVLEHYDKESGLELVEAVHGSLKPGGRTLITVPNMANPVTASRSRYMDITHEVSYTEESLGYLLRVAGFSNATLHPVDQYCLPNPLFNLAGRAAGWAFFKLLRLVYLLNAVRSTRIYTKALLAVGDA